MAIIIIAVWFGCGAYAMLINVERTLRVYSSHTGCDWVQDFATLMLGPFGLWFVMSAGGRFCFWR